MKRFRFRLERVLRARRITERERRRELAEAIGEADRIEAELNAAAEARREAETQIASLRTESAAAGVQSALESALRSIRRRAAVHAASYAKAMNEVERARATMVKARGEAESLEKLRAKHRAEWEQEVSRADQKANDEVAARMAEGRVAR